MFFVKRLLVEEIKANQIKQKEEEQKKYEEQQQRQSNCRLPCLKILDLSLSSSDKKLVFARYNNWIMIPWFCISALFDPPLSENTIERFVCKILLGNKIFIQRISLGNAL